MLVFDVVVYLLLFLMAMIVLVRFFVIYRGFIPLISIAALIVGLLIFKTSLPKIFEYPLNAFYITYHNVDIYDYKKFAPKIDTKVDIDYFAKKFYNDKNKDFYIKMDGYFVALLPVKKEIYIDNHWARVEIYLDGKLLKSVKAMKTKLDIEFSSGVHHLELYVYNSDVSVTMMHVGISDYVPVISDENLTQELRKIVKEEDYNLYFTTQYSDKTLNLKDSAKSSILFLSSTGTATYKIKNIKGSNTKAVVYSGIGTKFHFDGEVKLLRIEKMPSVHTVFPRVMECVNQAPMGIHCPSFKEFTSLGEWMQKLLGKKITGFTKSEDKRVGSVTVPELQLDAKKYQEINATIEAIKVQKEELTKRVADPFYPYKGMRWFDVLHVNEADVPSNAFQAYYMDKFDVSKVKYSEIVTKVSLDYSHNKFHGIPADNFVGYWIGDFAFARPLTYEFDVSISWSKIKIIINDEVVYDGDRSTSFTYKFAPGKRYRIEVEYINNYGQVDMQVNMKKPVKQLEDESLKQLMTKDTKVYLFGTYESRRSDHGMDIVMQDSDAETILFLASYEAINYDIKNAKGAKLKAVIYNAYTPVGSIHVDASDVKVFQDKKLRYAGRVMPFCYEGAFKYCENKNAFTDAVSRIVTLTGKKPDGFSSIEEPSFETNRLKRLDEKTTAVTVPQMLLDGDAYFKIQQKMKQLR